MSCRRNNTEITGLADLARLREAVAQGECAQIASDLISLDRRIEEIQSRTFDATTPLEASVALKWRAWQNRKLRELVAQRASLTIRHREAIEKYGRMVAESSVIRKLSRQQSARVDRNKQRRRDYTS